MHDLIRKEILDGIYFNSIKDARYKTNKISVNIVTKLEKENASINALLPNILRKGYEDCPSFTQLNKMLEELYGAYLDYGVEKYGDNQVVNMSLTTIDDSFSFDNEEVTGKMTQLLCNLVLNPVFEDGKFIASDMEIEKEILIDTIKAEINDKRSYVLTKSNALMCKDEPHGIKKYGDIDEVKSITADSLTEGYKAFIENSGIEIMFIGCGNSDKAEEIFTKRFNTLKRNATKFEGSKFHAPLEKTIEHTETMQVSQSKMVLGFSVEENISSEEIYALIVMSAIFGGTPMSKLFVNVREKLSLCYYCVSRLERTKMILRVDCGVENQNIDKAKTAILDQLEQIKLGNVTDEELKNAVMSLSNSYNTVRDHASALEVYYLAQILRNNINSPENEIIRLNKVTKEQVINVVKKIKLDISYVLTSEGAKE